MSQEIERLNNNLRAKIEEINQLERDLKNAEFKLTSEYQTKISTYESRIRQFTGDNEEMGRRIKEYDNRIVSLTQEIERLNGVLRTKVDENEGLQRELKNYEYRVSSEFQSKITTYESRIRQFTSEHEEFSRRVSEYEGRIVSLTQEIERLNGVLRTKVDENEGLQRELKNYEYRVSSEFQSKITTYESRMRQFSTEKEDL